MTTPTVLDATRAGFRIIRLANRWWVLGPLDESETRFRFRRLEHAVAFIRGALEARR